jgi:hypothetical protein
MWPPFMTTTKKRENFLLWLEQFTKFKEVANGNGISASELLEEAVNAFEYPDDRPLKPRALTINDSTSVKIQEIADKFFNTPGRNAPGNRGRAVEYIIEQYLKKKGK